MKFSGAVSRVKWLNGEKNRSFEDHLCHCPQGADMDIDIHYYMDLIVIQGVAIKLSV
jgi:hypothetical protein